MQKLYSAILTMGNNSSNDISHPFVGREEELNDVLGKLTLKTIRLLTICGISKCGKTRFLEKVLGALEKDKSIKCYSCFLDNEDSDIKNTILDLVRTLLTDENHFSSIKDALEKLIKFFSSETCFLVIDNIDVLLKNDLQDTLYKFTIEALNKCRYLKIVLSGSTKLKFAKPVFSEVILKPIGVEDLQEIIHNASNGILKQSNKDDVYIKGIAVLCEGLPHPATMAGCLLQEDCGMIKPRELMELMIYCRKATLSPENYPKDDRLDFLMQAICENEIGKMLSDCLTELVKKVSSNNFSVEEAYCISRDNNINETMALFKMKTLRELLGRSIVSTNDGKVINLNGILRECKLLMNIEADLVKNEITRDITIIDRVVKENLKAVELDIPEEHQSDLSYIESALKELVMESPMEQGTMDLQELVVDEMPCEDQELTGIKPNVEKQEPLQSPTKFRARYFSENNDSELAIVLENSVQVGPSVDVMAEESEQVERTAPPEYSFEDPYPGGRTNAPHQVPSGTSQKNTETRDQCAHLQHSSKNSCPSVAHDPVQETAQEVPDDQFCSSGPPALPPISNTYETNPKSEQQQYLNVSSPERSPSSRSLNDSD